MAKDSSRTKGNPQTRQKQWHRGEEMKRMKRKDTGRVSAVVSQDLSVDCSPSLLSVSLVISSVFAMSEFTSPVS